MSIIQLNEKKRVRGFSIGDKLIMLKEGPNDFKPGLLKQLRQDKIFGRLEIIDIITILEEDKIDKPKETDKPKEIDRGDKK